MNNISVVVLTPDGYRLKTQSQQIRLPAVKGECEVRSQHAVTVMALQSGVLSLGPMGSDEKFFVDRGYVRVGPEMVEVIVEVFEKTSDIDIKRAKDAFARANKFLNQRQVGVVDVDRALLALKRAQLRLGLKNEGYL
jgi:F-type H+-transporting ATPase subunit epsilon